MARGLRSGPIVERKLEDHGSPSLPDDSQMEGNKALDKEGRVYGWRALGVGEPGRTRRRGDLAGLESVWAEGSGLDGFVRRPKRRSAVETGPRTTPWESFLRSRYQPPPNL